MKKHMQTPQGAALDTAIDQQAKRFAGMLMNWRLIKDDPKSPLLAQDEEIRAALVQGFKEALAAFAHVSAETDKIGFDDAHIEIPLDSNRSQIRQSVPILRLEEELKQCALVKTYSERHPIARYDTRELVAKSLYGSVIAAALDAGKKLGINVDQCHVPLKYFEKTINGKYQGR